MNSPKNYRPLLKIRLILLFIALSSIILITVFSVNYYLIRDNLKKNFENSSLQQYRQTEYNILNLFKNIDKYSKMLIMDEAIHEFLSDYTFNDQDYKSYSIKNDLYKTFSSIININDDIESISILKDSMTIFSVTTTDMYYETESKKFEWFYNTDYFRKPDAFKSVIWIASKEGKDAFCISAIRRIYVAEPKGEYSYLIINIKEGSLLNIYNYYNQGQSSNNKTYLIDSSGTIISDTDKMMINTKCSFYTKIPFDIKEGYFQFTDDNNSKQVVFGEIGDTGLFYISEISLSAFSNSTIVLRNVILIIFVASFAFSVLISISFISTITKPIDKIVKVMGEIEKGNIGIILKTIPNSEIGIIWERFNRMSKQIKILIEKNKKDEEEKRLLEIEALQYQINPHFIYNSLNTIRWMSIFYGTQNITKSVDALTNILRGIFSQQNICHKIEDEIIYLENYIVMMNYRFGGRIKLNAMIDDLLKDVYIPRFILQPLIENSIVHGMREADLYLTITIRASMSDSRIEINITDTGKGMDNQKIDHVLETISQTEPMIKSALFGSIQNSIGLKNVNRRLMLHYGEEFGLVIDRDIRNGTSVRIIIPAKTSQSL